MGPSQGFQYMYRAQLVLHPLGMCGIKPGFQIMISMCGTNLGLYFNVCRDQVMGSSHRFQCMLFGVGGTCVESRQGLNHMCGLKSEIHNSVMGCMCGFKSMLDTMSKLPGVIRQVPGILSSTNSSIQCNQIIVSSHVVCPLVESHEQMAGFCTCAQHTCERHSRYKLQCSSTVHNAHIYLHKGSIIHIHVALGWVYVCTCPFCIALHHFANSPSGELPTHHGMSSPTHANQAPWKQTRGAEAILSTCLICLLKSRIKYHISKLGASTPCLLNKAFVGNPTPDP